LLELSRTFWNVLKASYRNGDQGENEGGRGEAVTTFLQRKETPTNESEENEK